MNSQEKNDIKLIRKDINAYSALPDARKTNPVTWAAINDNPSNINYVPKDKLSAEIINLAVKLDGWVLEFVPEKMKTPEICRSAIENNAWALKFVPENLKTKELCRIATRSVYDLDYYGSNLLTFVPFPDVCLEALKAYRHTYIEPHNAIASINPQIMTPEIADYAISIVPSCFPLLPERLKTADFCLRAVQQKVSLEDIPEYLRIKELSEAATRSNYSNMSFVPEKIKTADFYEQTLKNDPFAIQYIPEKYLTYKQCLKAVETTKSSHVLAYIPFTNIHHKMLNVICENSATAHIYLAFVKPDYTDQKIANRIFGENPRLFFYIPEEYKSKEMCEAAIGHSGSNLKYVPNCHKTKELCESAIKNSYEAIPYILDEMKGVDEYMEMVKANPQNLNGIPSKDITDAMCKVALDNTFGKDKYDFSVVGAVRSSAMIHEIFKAHDDSGLIKDLLHIVKKDRLTSDIAKEIVQKDGNCLRYIPNEIITPEIAGLAVKNAPEALNMVPEQLRTPDMFLYTRKAVEDYNIHIPYEIRYGENIYAFHKKVEKALNKPLLYDEHKRLYNGERIKIKNVRTPDGLVRNGEVYYDPKQKKLNIYTVIPSVAKKQNIPRQLGQKEHQKRKGKKF